jgi:hypothetical protein
MWVWPCVCVTTWLHHVAAPCGCGKLVCACRLIGGWLPVVSKCNVDLTNVPQLPTGVTRGWWTAVTTAFGSAVPVFSGSLAFSGVTVQIVGMPSLSASAGGRPPPPPPRGADGATASGHNTPCRGLLLPGRPRLPQSNPIRVQWLGEPSSWVTIFLFYCSVCLNWSADVTLPHKLEGQDDHLAGESLVANWYGARVNCE